MHNCHKGIHVYRYDQIQWKASDVQIPKFLLAKMLSLSIVQLPLILTSRRPFGLDAALVNKLVPCAWLLSGTLENMYIQSIDLPSTSSKCVLFQIPRK